MDDSNTKARCRQILFPAVDVRAILEGRKTQTRQPVKLPRVARRSGYSESDIHKITELQYYDGSASAYVDDDSYVVKCPYGKPGDLLWVRETFCIYPDDNENPICVYRATDLKPDTEKWIPSNHLPRWASRITLKIIDIRVECLQEITDEEILAEGVRVRRMQYMPGNIRKVFQSYWDEIYEKRGYSWESNPWVWVIEFEPIFGSDLKRDNPRTCRICGCDDLHACMTEEGPCYWVEEDLCSACSKQGLLS